MRACIYLLLSSLVYSPYIMHVKKEKTQQSSSSNFVVLE